VKPRPLTLAKESISIGTSLALDDIGGSIGVGLVGYSPFAVGSSFFMVSFLIFLSGNYMIKLFDKLKISGKITTVLSGLVMIAIGISQVIE
jgi:putative Mn2+ efflux pump MntP